MMMMGAKQESLGLPQRIRDILFDCLSENFVKDALLDDDLGVFRRGLVNALDPVIVGILKTEGLVAQSVDGAELVALRKDRDRVDQIEKFGFRVECQMRIQGDQSTYDVWRPVDFEHDDPEWPTLREAIDATVPRPPLTEVLDE